MNSVFSLCPECLARFRGLRFDPLASRGSNLIPYNSIYWRDEFPIGQDQGKHLDHEPCKGSIIRLMMVRRMIWTCGQVAKPVQSFLAQAQELIPDWPGFQRMGLSRADRDALDFCDEETDGLMDGFRKDSSVFALTDEGDGVVSFAAHPLPKTQPPKPGGPDPGGPGTN